MRGSVIRNSGKASRTRTPILVLDDKLAAMYFLAKGSYETAKDHGIRLQSSDEVMAEEFKGLATNFLRISELLVEAGFRP